MTDSRISDEPVVDTVAPSLLERLKPKFKWIGGALASIAAVGAVVGGLTGYWNAWKAVKTEMAPSAKAPNATPTLVVSKGPSVAVLPLTTAAGGALDAFADTMTQQLTSSLGRFSTLRVTQRATAAEFAKEGSAAEAARKAGVDYLVTGEIRLLGEGARASVQVADLRSGAEIWSKSFDADADGLRTSTAGYELGDTAAAQIGGYPGVIFNADYKKIQSKPVAELTSYECIVHAIMATVLIAPPVVIKSRECLDRIVRDEPTNALAWAMRSNVLNNQKYWGVGLAPELAKNLSRRQFLNEEILQNATRAVELAPDDPTVRRQFATAISAKCQIDLYRQEVQKSLSLNPNDPRVLGGLGIQLAFMGDWDDGVAMADKALRLAGPNASLYWWFGPAKRHWWRGEYREALQDFRQAYVEGFWLTHLDQAYTLPFLDRLDEAKAEVVKVLKLRPDFTIREADAYYRMFCFQPAYIEKMNGALRQAGLPE